MTLKQEIKLGMDMSEIDKFLNQLDKGFSGSIEKEIKDINKTFDELKSQAKTLDEYKQASGMADSFGQKLGKKTGGLFGDMPELNGAMKMVTQFLPMIAGGVAVASVVMKALEPVTKIVDQIGTMLSQLLRPIADIFIVLLRPILSLLQPIIQVANALMMPFRQIAMQLSASAMRDIVTGMRESNSGLIGSGFAKSLASAIALTTGISAMLRTLILEGVNLIIDAAARLQALMIRAIATIVGGLTSVFDKTLGKQVMAVGGTLAGATIGSAEILKALVSDLSDYASQQQLTGVGLLAEALGVQVNDAIYSTFSDKSIGDVFTTAIDANKTLLTDVAEQMVFIFSDEGEAVLKDLTFNEAFTQFEKTIVDGVTSALEAAEQAISGRQGTGGGGFFATSIFGQKVGPQSMTEESSEALFGPVTQSFTDGMGNILTTAEGAFGKGEAKGTIPLAVQQGMDAMNQITLTNFGESGTIPKTFDTSLRNMSSSTQDFATSVRSITTIISDAVAGMKRYASAYYSAKREIENMKNKERTRRRNAR